MDIILASTSPYRRALLERLLLPFRSLAPGIDETPHPGESPPALARRLALAKARAVADRHPRALVIGSDQVAARNGRFLPKPGNLENARRQLLDSVGREVLFYTAVALVFPGDQRERCHVETTAARFRQLTPSQVEGYLAREEPFDCAGSFKVEGLGIALFEGIAGRDPSALEGLPLIALTDLLAEAGVEILRP
jgi:MAF protein